VEAEAYIDKQAERLRWKITGNTLLQREKEVGPSALLALCRAAVAWHSGYPVTGLPCSSLSHHTARQCVVSTKNDCIRSSKIVVQVYRVFHLCPSR
jgi:hypothetical protein